MPASIPDPSPSAIDRSALDAWFDREFTARSPAAVAGLVVGDELAWHRAVGARDGRGGPPPDRRSMFRIGSITKVLTGIAVMQLRERGVVDLDAPVASWVPELAARLAPSGQPAVTLRHLVTHTSGIPSIGDSSAPYWQQTPPSEQAMLKALDTPLAFAPGTQSEYSNAGMALAGVVVARASRRPYRDYMVSEVLGPIGMASAWDASAIAAERRVAGRAADGTIDPPTWQLGAFEPAGGLWASLDDMIALARFANGRPGADRVLSAEARRHMITDDPLPGAHGVAWVAAEGGAGHTGSTADFSATIIVFPGAAVAALVLSSGPDFELTDCAGGGLVRTAVLRQPLPSCARAPAAALDPALQRAAFDRLLAFLAQPDEASAGAAFAPAFLAQLPAPRLIETVGQLHQLAGACTAHAVGHEGVAAGEAVLLCAKAKLRLSYVLDGGAPSRFLQLEVRGIE